MNIEISRLRIGVLALAGALLLAACATGPEIRRDTNPAANFAAYRSFAFLSPLSTDKAGYETLFSARLKAAARRAMEAKGYVYREAEPDLLVNFYANMEEKQEVRTSPLSFGYYGYRRGLYGGFATPMIETVDYKEGTLTIDLVDARQKVLMWQGTAEGRVPRKALQNPGPSIDATVNLLLEPLPRAGQM